MYFLLGIILLTFTTIYCAPKIVRKKMNFYVFSLILLIFYALIFLYLKHSLLYAFLTCFCICGCGWCLVQKKHKQHDPNCIPDSKIKNGVNIFIYRELRAAKIDYYRFWFFRLVLTNLIAVSLIAIAHYLQ